MPLSPAPLPLAGEGLGEEGVSIKVNGVATCVAKNYDVRAIAL